jgi:hypothetical protein
LAFSGGMTARFAVSAELLVLEFADGVADGEAELACAATVVQKTKSAHTRQSRCFTIIDYLSVS